ncbi:hypothetical protein DK419_14625 [Methylobacterium terrae]|uniref:Uncharacterized protein n=1 Tax=Methylobacterium terrae TaxID=2202827 RepID=A0A2U8WPI0_9HYPH|nr:hypothetical protein DK419_14625 [Methylobacterium terrae]
MIHLTLGTAALAQGAGSSGNVNDCTFLKDPIELRNCILRFEGTGTPPPAVIEAPPPATPADGALPGTAAEESTGKPSGRRAKSRRARGRPQAPPVAPSRARDTPTSIEQVEIPPRAR